MRILISGNNTDGLSAAICKLFTDVTTCSRSNGYDLTNISTQERIAELSLEYDVFINCAALWRFEQTNLLNAIYKKCIEYNHRSHIICVGSTTDRTSKGNTWLYNAEKKALRDYCNSLALVGVWHSGPKVSYVSFGTLSNNQEKHPDRKCININEAAHYIKWLIDQPKYININEISIDPMQPDYWHD